MKILLILALTIALSACQANGYSNGKSGSASFLANVLTMEF